MANVNKSINDVIKRLKLIQRNADRVDYWFFDFSLRWIKNRANDLLDQRTNGYKSSNARDWKINIYDHNAILENKDMNSGAIEFGIGIKGQQNANLKAKNDPRIVAQENNYVYNQSSKYKDDTFGWTFQLPNGNYIYTHGYGGKSFLFDAFMEYLSKNMHNIFYQRAFDKVMKGIEVK